ncbi:NAD(P)-binding protein [Cenococcum geophilum 1.58]|uniref:NAD(P)-binding protein n=1 Tax=Cenococcum geophilum 1.58 TaxID=794803 RepID=UPI00358FD06C|nr:NAD(P)-binding protein [Cenococcum geophilum 1.58]
MATNSHKMLLVILGATGAQGGPTARYILKYSSHLYRIRAVTRDPSKPAGRELASLGAEVVAADFDDEASITAALDGAHAIFTITNFWDKNSLEIEVGQGKLLNRIASELPDLQHYVFSSLPDPRGLAGGKFQGILPYNAKAALREDLKSYPALHSKTTEVWIAYYFQNWVKYQAVFGPVKQDDGSFMLAMPYPASTKIPTCSSDDTGALIHSILNGREEYYGKTVALIGDLLTEEDRVKIWAEGLGVSARFLQLSPEEHLRKVKSLGLPDDLAVAVNQLQESLPLEQAVMEATGIVQGNKILPKDYKLKTWMEYVKEEDWSSFD